MDVKQYRIFVNMLWPSLQKQDEVIRGSIKPYEMCCFMLRYLGSEGSNRSLEHQCRISQKVISYITDESLRF